MSKEAQSPEGVCEVSPDPLTIGVMLAPGVATMSTSCIVKDEGTGVTYMDTVTTSVGIVALSGPEQETCLRSNQITAFGWWGEPTTTAEQTNQQMTAYGQINLPMTTSE